MPLVCKKSFVLLSAPLSSSCVTGVTFAFPSVDFCSCLTSCPTAALDNRPAPIIAVNARSAFTLFMFPPLLLGYNHDWCLARPSKPHRAQTVENALAGFDALQ